MKQSPIASTFIASLSCLLPDPAAPALAFHEIPVYEPVPIAQLIHDPQPTACVSTEENGVHLLPGLDGWTSHRALDISDPDPSAVGRIAGYAQSSIPEPRCAVLWLHDTMAGAPVERPSFFAMRVTVNGKTSAQ